MNKVFKNLDVIVALILFTLLFVIVLICGYRAYNMENTWIKSEGIIENTWDKGNTHYHTYSWKVTGHKYMTTKSGVSLKTGPTVVVINPDDTTKAIPLDDLKPIKAGVIMMFVAFIVILGLGIYGISEKRKIEENKDE